MKNIIFIIVILFSIQTIFADGVQPTGSGSETDPYLISNLDNLLWLSTTPDVWDDNAHFLQTADIDASDTENWNGGVGFSPIGSLNAPFYGYYDGGMHQIVDLFIGLVEFQNGLFGVINSSEIENVSLEVDLDCLTTSGNTGGIAGLANSSTISNCHVSGSIVGDERTGGIVGSCINFSTISRCSSSALVSGFFETGGITGYCDESIVSNCFNNGELTGFAGILLGHGGIVGSAFNNSEIFNCYSISNISDYQEVGALLYNNNSSSVHNCVWNDSLYNGELYAVYTNTDGTIDNIINCTENEMRQESTYTSLGWDFVGESVNGSEEIWGIQENINDGFPFVYNQQLVSNFAVSNDVVDIEETLQFTDSSYGNPTSWEWDFESDGIIDSYEQNPIWTYDEFGVYDVTLTISNETGSDSLIKEDYVTVNHIINGSGTETDPYQISSYSDLKWISVSCENNNGFNDTYFLQTNDIDASASQTDVMGDYEWDLGFQAIGDYDNHFMGIYDGGGFVVDSLFVFDSAMFGYVHDAIISNLNVSNTFAHYAGLIVNSDNSEIINCHTSGRVDSDNPYEATGGIIGTASSTLVSNCTSICSVEAEGYIEQWVQIMNYGGGVIGRSINSEVIDCSFFGETIPSYALMGGVVGACISSTLSNCSSESEINGYGLVAHASNSTFSRCTFTGPLNCIVSHSFFGRDFELNSASNCYYDYETVIINSGHRVSEFALPSDLYYDWIANDMSIDEIYIDDYLTYNDSAYQLNSFDEIKYLIHFGSISSFCFSLNSDIDLQDQANFYIPKMISNINGNNYTISNYSLIKDENCGFFAQAQGCTIENLKFDNCELEGEDNTGVVCGSISNTTLDNIDLNNVSVEGDDSVGGLCGIATNSCLITDVEIFNVNVLSKNNAGGLVGFACDTAISNCYVNGHSGACYSEYWGYHDFYSLSDGLKAGGLIGFAQDSMISDSYFLGSSGARIQSGGLVGFLSNSSLTESYSLSIVSASESVGGLVGEANDDSVISNCYTSSSLGCIESYYVSSASNVGGLVGLLGNSFIEDCYSVTRFPDNVVDSSTGGFIGTSVNSSASNCIWNITLTELSNSIGNTDNTTNSIISLISSEMRDIQSYLNIGWDFLGETANGSEDIWTIDTSLNNGYPYLVALEQSVGIYEPEVQQPQLQTKLYSAYPNPFNPTTTISFDVAKDDVAELSIYNIRGQMVKRYKGFSEGKNTVVWEGLDRNNKQCATGVYFYRLKSNSYNVTKKMMLMK